MRAANQALRGAGTEPAAPRQRRPGHGDGQGRSARRRTRTSPTTGWQGGKRSRPFITLAAYDALKGGAGTRSAEAQRCPTRSSGRPWPSRRFTRPRWFTTTSRTTTPSATARRRCTASFGVGTAINVGDYLLGLGYRLVSRERKELGGDCTADILNRLSDAHLKLSEGQGAELLWRDAADKTLIALDALKIYALKTAPAFEAALYAGVRLAGDAERYEKPIGRVQQESGRRVPDPQRSEGLGGRQRQQAHSAARTCWPPGRRCCSPWPWKVCRRPNARNCWPARGERPANSETPSSSRAIRRLFERARVFEKAEKLVEKYRARAEVLADEIEPTESARAALLPGR